MRGKKRPLAERAEAVGIALATGNVAEAARQTGLAESTIHQWVDAPDFAELRGRTKEQVADEWWAGVQHGFRVVIEAFDGPGRIMEKATAAAILFDKLALTRGEATARTEVIGDNDERDRLRETLRRLREELDAERTASAGEGSSGGVVVSGSEGAART